MDTVLRYVPSLYQGVADTFPDAEQLTFDKFYIMKVVNDAVDHVRREEQKKLRKQLLGMISGSTTF